MVGILIILALMFVIICAVLQMFSRLEPRDHIIYIIIIIITTTIIIIMFQSSVYRKQIHIQHSQREADEFYIPERSCPPSYNLTMFTFYCQAGLNQAEGRQEPGSSLDVGK